MQQAGVVASDDDVVDHGAGDEVEAGVAGAEGERDEGEADRVTPIRAHEGGDAAPEAPVELAGEFLFVLGVVVGHGCGVLSGRLDSIDPIRF